MLLEYKDGSGGEKSEKNWLRNKWKLPNYIICKLLLNWFVFFLLKFFILCDISAELLNFIYITSSLQYRSLCTVIVQLLLSNTCDLFSRIFAVFNEIEMEINVINNNIFTKFYLKIRVREKEISWYTIF